MTTWEHRVRTVASMQHAWQGLGWRDWALPAVLLVYGQLDVWLGWQRVADGPPILFSAVGVFSCLALVERRRHPLAVLVVVAATGVIPALFGWFAESQSQVLVLVVAIFAAGRYAAPPWAYLAVPFSVGLLLLITALSPFTDFAASWAWSLNAVWIFTLGAAFRHEHQLQERASAAGTAQARAEAAEAQLRAARDLHDVLSHSLAVIVVQAEVADTYLDTDPDRARQAIARLTQVGRSTLSDTRNIVALLRDASVDRSSVIPPSDSAPGEVEAASPGIDQVPGLIDTVRDSGVPVTLREEHELPALTPQASHAAYRVVQEGLTNVIRHAGNAATVVTLTRSVTDLVIEVADRGSGVSPSAPAGGHGLTGMRERVTACGGSFSAGPDEACGFVIRATLPGIARP
jgi:signal transduction histidine kinase